MTYRFGSSRYRIRFTNDSGVSSGIARILLDNEELSGERVPLADDGREHEVLVEMGARLSQGL